MYVDETSHKMATFVVFLMGFAALSVVGLIVGGINVVVFSSVMTVMS